MKQASNLSTDQGGGKRRASTTSYSSLNSLRVIDRSRAASRTPLFVARTLVDNAIDGDTTAVKECFDRMDGKVTQSADATQVRGDVTFTWVRPAD